MEIIFEDVISRIKAQMEMRGYSVYAFAKALGIPQPTTDAYINGKRKPSLDFLYRVCSICNCSADDLLGLPARASGGSVMTDLAELRLRADQAKQSLENLSKAIDKIKIETRS